MQRTSTIATQGSFPVALTTILRYSLLSLFLAGTLISCSSATLLDASELLDTTADGNQAVVSQPDSNPDPAIGRPASCGSERARFRSQMLILFNRARAAARYCGEIEFPAANPVTWNHQLEAAAGIHSKDMAVNDFFSHTGSNGLSVSERVTNQGYQWRAVGENIAGGQFTAEEVVAGWLSSSDHCRNIMNADFTELGVACSTATNTQFPEYWTNVLGRHLP